MDNSEIKNSKGRPLRILLKAVGMIVPLLSFPIAARALGPDALGRVSILLAALTAAALCFVSLKRNRRIFIIGSNYAAAVTALLQIAGLALVYKFVKDGGDGIKYAAVRILCGGLVLVMLNAVRVISRGKRLWSRSSKQRAGLFPVFLGPAAALILMNCIETVLLGKLSGPVPAGLYTAAGKIPLVASALFISAFGFLWARMGASDDLEINEAGDSPAGPCVLAFAVFSLIQLLLIPASVGIVSVAPMLIKVSYGADYADAAPAAALLGLRLFTGVMNAAAARFVLLPLGKKKAVIGSALFSAAVDIALCAFLVPKFGLMGTASASLYSGLILFVIFASLGRKALGLKTLVQRAPLRIVASLWFIPAARFIEGRTASPWAALLITVAVCVLGYFALMLAIKDPALRYARDRAGEFIKSRKAE
ncbi:MAG: polysaccharide biosynthesis protein [Firmicutes bacterium]|nr:polysaccharide biosynthesis protein [Bacillota bacterium]